MSLGRTRVPALVRLSSKPFPARTLTPSRSADRPTPYSSTSSFSVGISVPGLILPRTIAAPEVVHHPTVAHTAWDSS